MKKQKLNIKSHTKSWVIKDGKLCYDEELGFNMSFGYMTQFKYLESRGVDQHILTKYLGLEVESGKFAYRLMCDKFDVILGVSGNLKCINEIQHQYLINHLKIPIHTYIPNYYHNLQVEPSIRIVDKTHDVAGKLKDTIIEGLRY